MTIEAVLFDLDDTLVWRSESPDWAWVTSLQAAAISPHCARLGFGALDLEEVVRRMWATLAATYPEPDLFPDVPLEERRWIDGPRFLRETLAGVGVLCADADAICLWEALNGAPFRMRHHHLYPDAVSTVQALRASGYRLAITTARPQSAAVVAREMHRHGMPDLFDVVVTSGEIGYRKPHPLVFAQAAELLGVRPERSVVVGDSYELDIVPPAGLGMVPVLKLNDRAPDPRWTEARAQIPSLTALLDLDFLRPL